jgi:hypothetical protein
LISIDGLSSKNQRGGGGHDRDDAGGQHADGEPLDAVAGHPIRVHFDAQLLDLVPQFLAKLEQVPFGGGEIEITYHDHLLEARAAPTRGFDDGRTLPRFGIARPESGTPLATPPMI